MHNIVLATLTWYPGVFIVGKLANCMMYAVIVIVLAIHAYNIQFHTQTRRLNLSLGEYSVLPNVYCLCRQLIIII